MLSTNRRGGGFSPVNARQSIVVTQEYKETVQLKDFRSVGLGGWTLDANHVYDPFGPTLHMGTGPRRGTQSLPDVVTTVAELPSFLDSAHKLKINEKGEIIYVSTAFGSAIIKLGTDNSTTILLETTTSIGEIALAPDGTIYWTPLFGIGDNAVRKLNPGESIPIIVAGTPTTAGFFGDGGLAKDALLNAPNGVTVDKEGNLYIADRNNQRVRMVDTNGIITTIAGTNDRGNIFMTNEQLNLPGPATQAILGVPESLEVDDKGNLFIVDNGTRKIIKIDARGIATHFAGSNSGNGLTDGIPATETRMLHPADMALGEDGSLYWIRSV